MSHMPFTRRRFISALTLPTLLIPLGHIAFADRLLSQNHLEKFLDVSQSLTGYQALNHELAQRYLEAFNRLYPEFLTKMDHLNAQDSIFQAMNHPDSKETAMQIVHAWYTGTVGPNDAGEVNVIAYKNALMYRPTADGLPVPTYCFRGELWFSELPPGITQQPITPITF